MTFLAVMVGGAIGSSARHATNLLFLRWLERPAPYATAAVNVAGSLVIGVLAGALAGEKFSMTAEWRAFVFVGILGGFTTFSSFMLDTLALVQGRDLAAAASNVVLQNALGFALALAGYRLAAMAG